MNDTAIVATAPGRVNLIGDHTDTTDGWCLPMAIDLAVTLRGTRGGDTVSLRSTLEAEPAIVPVNHDPDLDGPSSSRPAWARYVAGVVSELRPSTGLVGVVTSTLPAGAGLSSSAALEVAVALALGFEGDPLQLARLCQRAEQQASGVPCGLMDQMASIFGVDGHALWLDCLNLTVEPVRLPDYAEVVVVHSGTSRRLAGSAYAARRRQVKAAQQIVGPLRRSSLEELSAIADDVLRRRARHVITENQRVQAFAAALGADDVAAAGALMIESHASLRDDFEVSTPALDGLVERLTATPGVWGARLTGAGFGGCVVALTATGALESSPGVWRVRPSSGAHCRRTAEPRPASPPGSLDLLGPFEHPVVVSCQTEQ